jgi:hypothetical protein
MRTRGRNPADPGLEMVFAAVHESELGTGLKISAVQQPSMRCPLVTHFGTRNRNTAIVPGTAQRLAEFAADLVRINVDVIVTSGTPQVVL